MKNLLKVVTWITGILSGLGISIGVAKFGAWILTFIFDEEGVFAEKHPIISVEIAVLYIVISALVPFWLVTEVIFKLCIKISDKIDERFDWNTKDNEDDEKDWN